MEKSGEVVILIADMNNLKIINDCYGHAKGDEAILQMGKLLKNILKRITNAIVWVVMNFV